jgi:hypothetical protein
MRPGFVATLVAELLSFATFWLTLKTLAVIVANIVLQKWWEIRDEYRLREG